MKIKFIKASNWLLSLAIGAIGFTSCSNGGGPDEYGTPTAEFKVSGKVTDTEEMPVEGIEVSMKAESYVSPNELKDTTDSKGEYKIRFRGFPLRDSIVMEFKDIDTNKNGAFATKTDGVRFEKFTGGDGHWDQGTSEVLKNIKLERIIEDK